MSHSSERVSPTAPATPPTPQEAARLMRLATYASLTVAVLLIAVKTFAWSATGAVTLLASLVDSAMDAVASLVNLLAVRHALTPADREHRFGHGKAEALSGLGQAVLVAGSALYLLVEAVDRLLHPVAPQAIGAGVAVMLFSIVVTLALVTLQHRVALRTGSTAVSADALHYRTDLLVNAGVILALLLASWGWPGFDPVFALAIGLYILYSAYAIVRQALDHLMDRELPEPERERIRSIVLAHPRVRGLHDMRTRSSGTSHFVQLHLELDDYLTLLQAHRISDEVEDSLAAEFPGTELIIHKDPVSVVGGEDMPPYETGRYSASDIAGSPPAEPRD